MEKRKNYELIGHDRQRISDSLILYKNLLIPGFALFFWIPVQKNTVVSLLLPEEDTHFYTKPIKCLSFVIAKKYNENINAFILPYLTSWFICFGLSSLSVLFACLGGGVGSICIAYNANSCMK